MVMTSQLYVTWLKALDLIHRWKGFLGIKMVYYCKLCEIQTLTVLRTTRGLWFSKTLVSGMEENTLVFSKCYYVMSENITCRIPLWLGVSLHIQCNSGWYGHQRTRPKTIRAIPGYPYTVLSGTRNSTEETWRTNALLIPKYKSIYEQQEKKPKKNSYLWLLFSFDLHMPKTLG